jgi:ribosomal protein S27AE
MPRLVCFTCGRTLWATLPAAQLFAEERRCPKCGEPLADDRRLLARRTGFGRRQVTKGESPTGEERRSEERRKYQRRKPV